MLLEMDFSEAYTMITDQAAMSTCWTDKSINLHISVAERSLQPMDYQYLMDVEDSDWKCFTTFLLTSQKRLMPFWTLPCCIICYILMKEKVREIMYKLASNSLTTASRRV